MRPYVHKSQTPRNLLVCRDLGLNGRVRQAVFRPQLGAFSSAVNDEKEIVCQPAVGSRQVQQVGVLVQPAGVPTPRRVGTAGPTSDAREEKG